MFVQLGKRFVNMDRITFVEFLRTPDIKANTGIAVFFGNDQMLLFGLEESGVGDFINMISRQPSEIHTDLVEQTYVSTRCERHPNVMSLATALYQDYAEWCKQQGYRPKPIQVMSRVWERMDFQRIRRGGILYFRGIKPLSANGAAE